MPELVYEGRFVDVEEYVRSVVEIHAAQTPFWREFKEKKGFDLVKEIRSFDDLKKLPYLTDDDLRRRPPEDFAPCGLPAGERVLSHSSGTTGERKRVYWSRGVIKHLVNYVEWSLRNEKFPEGEPWICTGPDNDLMKAFIGDACERFKGKERYVEVDAGKAKKAFHEKDPVAIKEFLDSVCGAVVEHADAHGMGVYEDIAPLMVETARRLSAEKRLEVRGLLFGGVETTLDKIRFLQRQFPNAKIGGWYGDFMNGTAMMREISDAGITYQSFFPFSVFELRRLGDVGEPAEYGEVGEIISHRVGPDIFIPNRRIGDKAERARPVAPLEWDAIRNVRRLGDP